MNTGDLQTKVPDSYKKRTAPKKDKPEHQEVDPNKK